MKVALGNKSLVKSMVEKTAEPFRVESTSSMCGSVKEVNAHPNFTSFCSEARLKRNIAKAATASL